MIRLRGVRRGTLRLFVFLFLVGVGGILLAARAGASPTCGITWTGNGTTQSWFEAANWDLSRTPQSGDFVCIPSGAGTVLIDQNSLARADGIHAESPIDQSAGYVYMDGPDPTDVSDYTLEGSGQLRDTTPTSDLPFTVTDSFTFAGGTLGFGTYTIPNGSTFTVQGSDVKSLYATIDSAGTIVWNGDVQTSAFGSVNSSGLIDWKSGDAAHAIVNSTGTLLADGAAPLSVDVGLQNDGVVSVPAGQDLTLKGGSRGVDTGSYVIDGVVRFTPTPNHSGYGLGGPVSGSGTIHVDGGAGVGFHATVTVDTVVVDDGIVSSEQPVDIGTLKVRTSYVGGPGALLGGTIDHLVISDNGTLSANTIHVTGQLDWTAGRLWNGPVILDAGTQTTISGNVALQGTIENHGTMTLATAAIAAPYTGQYTIDNEGLLDVAGGTSSAFVMHNAGALRVESGARLESAFDNYQGFIGDGALQGGTWEIHGALQFNFPGGGYHTDLTTVDAGLLLDGASAQVVGLDDLKSIPATGSLSLQNGAQLTTTTATTNQGTVALGAGALLQTQGSYTQTAGTTSLAPTATLQSQTGGVDVQGGTLSGRGTVGPSLSNEGAVEPDLGGTLHVAGSYTQSGGGTLRIHADTGTNGKLAATGAAQLGGVLDVQDAPGYTPSPGDVLGVLTAGSRAGTFSSITHNLPPSLGYAGQYTGTTASVQAFTIAPADLAAGLSVDPPVVAGGVATYHLSVTDNGPADNFGLSAVLSAAGALHPVSVPADCHMGGGDLTCTASGLANGATASWDVALKIDESLAAGSTLQLDAAVSSTTPASPDPNGSNDAASVQSTVQRSADLAVTQSDDVDPVLQGDPVTYTVHVADTGPGSANNVLVTNTITGDGGLQYAYSSQGYCYPNIDGSYTCNVGSLSGPGGNGPSSATVTVVALGEHPGSMQNEATVTSDDPDPSSGNNDSIESTQVSEAFADLAMVGGAQFSSVQADSPLDYTFIMSNNGPNRAVNPTETIHFGQPFILSYAQSTNGSCYASSAQDMTCPSGTVQSGDDVTIHLTIIPIAPGPLTSHATASGNETDPNPSNNAAEVDVTVTAEKGVQYVSVTDQGYDPQTVTAKPGQTVQWNFADIGPGQQHTATDPTGMGLFDSGYRSYSVSTYRFRFAAAGKYKVHDQVGGFDGVVKVPMTVKPGAGGVTTGFKLTWSKSAPPSGFVFDVQVKRPGTTTWVFWKSDTTLLNANFIPDGGVGTYHFRARLRRVSNAAASGWSGAKKIDVS